MSVSMVKEIKRRRKLGREAEADPTEKAPDAGFGVGIPRKKVGRN